MTNNNWGWYHSDDRERWSGPFTTRDEAIAEGRVCGSGYVCRARKGYYDLKVFDADDVIDRLDDFNSETTDPDGDGVLGHLSSEQRKDLETTIRDTLSSFCARHNINLDTWAFVETDSEEAINYEEETSNEPS